MDGKTNFRIEHTSNNSSEKNLKSFSTYIALKGIVSEKYYPFGFQRELFLSKLLRRIGIPDTTPYASWIAQGRLEALLNISNHDPVLNRWHGVWQSASLLDISTRTSTSLSRGSGDPSHRWGHTRHAPPSARWPCLLSRHNVRTKATGTQHRPKT